MGRGDRTLQSVSLRIVGQARRCGKRNSRTQCRQESAAGKHGKERCVIAVERDGTPRVPSEAAMMEYVLAMATRDVESRPKGGGKEYEGYSCIYGGRRAPHQLVGRCTCR